MSGKNADKPWRDEDGLRELYHEEGASLPEIAEVMGCSYRTIWNWFDRFDIPRRKSPQQKPVSFESHEKGYEIWREQSGGTNNNIRVHRLLAVSEFGFSEVAGMHVHHKNGVPWDNRPANIELVTSEEHNQLHHPKACGWLEVLRIREMYRNGAVSKQALSEMFGVSWSTVHAVTEATGAYAGDEGVYL